MKYLLLLIVNFYFLACANAQLYAISGSVKDTQGKPIIGASVTISNYKKGAISDKNGHFTIPSMQPGNYDVIFQYVGYSPISRNINIEKQAVNIDVQLQENITSLQEVVVAAKPNPDRAWQIRLFKELFIGLTPNAKKCEILNPQVLRVSYRRAEGILKISAADVLVIRNKALGYTIKYLLQDFEYNFKTKICYYAGLPTFQEISRSSSRNARYLQKRKIAYEGSNLHFFKSLLKGNTQQEGFVVLQLELRPNKNRLPDSTINQNIEKWRQLSLKNGVVIFNDSLSYWTRMKNQPKESTILNTKPRLPSYYSLPNDKGNPMLKFGDPLYIIYTKAKEDPAFADESELSLMRPKEYLDTQVSILSLLSDGVSILNDGNTDDPKALLYQGYWGWHKLADTVPLDDEN